jgi:hypothetical protein
LARSEGFPWIVDLRDPIRKERSLDGTNIQISVYRSLERTVARRADALITNTDAALARLQQRFPACKEKLHTIWNGFDLEERIQPLSVVSHDCKILSHVGELYGGRNAAPILESIARLIAAGRLPTGSVRVKLVGPADPRALPNQEFLAHAQAEGWLDLITEQVPHREALQIAQSSDSLLLLQPQSATQVPGKLFEYLQIGRPILAFVQRNSSVERLLERSGVPYRCIFPDYAPQSIDETIANFFDIPSTPVEASPWFEEQFNAEHQTLQLDAIIRMLHKEAVRPANPLLRVQVPSKAPQIPKTEDTANRT